LKRTRRIEIVHYRRLIVRDDPLPAADPKRPAAADILKEIASLSPPENVDDDELSEDHETAEDRLPPP
jgi:hypothetical protein